MEKEIEAATCIWCQKACTDKEFRCMRCGHDPRVERHRCACPQCHLVKTLGVGAPFVVRSSELKPDELDKLALEPGRLQYVEPPSVEPIKFPWQTESLSSWRVLVMYHLVLASDEKFLRVVMEKDGRCIEASGKDGAMVWLNLELQVDAIAREGSEL